MATVTVNELIQRAAAAADMEDDFVTRDTWLTWANVENRKLAGFVARSGYVLQEGREDITADGSLQYDIPGPLAILGVYELTGDGLFRRLKHSDLMDGAGFKNLAARGPASSWRAFQNTNDLVSVQLWPIPQSGSYKVFVIPHPPTLTMASTVTYPMNWEEAIVLGMARRALAKEETRNPALDGQYAEILQHIEASAWDRAFGAHQTVRNVDRVERGWSRHPEIPSARHWAFF